MPAKPPQKPPTQRRLMTGTLIDMDPSTVSRHLSELADRVSELDDQESTVHTLAPVTGTGTAKDPVTASTFTPIARGVVTPSGGGTTNFLRADGTWAAPGGGGGGAVASVTAGSTKVTVSPTTGAVVVDVVPSLFTGIPESGVTGLVADLAGKVASSRAIATTTPLTIDGGASADLSANRTLAIAANGITDALLRQGAARSVIARAGNSTGNVADLASAAAGTVLYDTGTALTFADLISLMPGGGNFGPATDGDLVFDGSSTIAGLVPSGGAYTLTRDIVAHNMTVNSGVRVKMAGWRIFGTGLLDGTGQIDCNGNAGGNGAIANVAGAAGAAAIAVTGYLAVTSLGGAGGSVGAGASPPSVSLTNAMFGLTGTAGAAGAAGAHNGSPGTGFGAGGGGGGGGNGGGGGGGVTAYAVTAGTILYGSTAMRLEIPATSTRIIGGGNGGAGGGAAGTGGSGGGGGGSTAGGVPIAFRLISTTIVIQSNGGNGGTCAAGGALLAGGGAGGGAAWVLLQTNTPAATLIAGGNISANGGAGGLGVNTGGTGGAGAPGKIYILN